LSPACSVMIIFSLSRCKIFGPNQPIQQLLHRFGCPPCHQLLYSQFSGRHVDESDIEYLSTLTT
jgi:hypothetical protein